MSNLCETLDAIEKTLDEMSCCPEPSQPYVTCCMITPPPILAPTKPEPVKPLQLPCPQPPRQPQMSEEEMYEKRYSNFYNNFNVNYRCAKYQPGAPPPRPKRPPPNEFDRTPLPGCPRGFKPCSMKLRPINGDHPCGIWCAEIQPCPKKRKNLEPYDGSPENCTRPCCKHWKPKEGEECLYDCPCKAHCFNHPIGIKPGRRAAGCCPPYIC